MPPSPAADLETLLEGLNPPQRDAVVHGDGPLLILAGAGSGKTRVLAHRIAHLLAMDAAKPSEILAITFTNKAAQEMRERVELLVGRATRAMWLMTFHSACTRMLRADAHRLGYTRSFSIYDAADSRRLIKQCLDDLDIDAKRFTPRAMQAQVSDAKNRLRDADAYRELVGSYFEQTVADVFQRYERELHRMNAMDFDDLLVRAVNVLELFPEVRARYQTAFRYVLVDEYQDTNHAQYRWLQLLASEHRNLAVVGDDDQCLVEGTLVTMGDGSVKPIEQVRVGDEVLGCYGSGDFRPAPVTAVHRARAREGVAITTASGRRIVSTPEHAHFAGFRYGMTPQRHLTYLMHRGDRYRVGTSRVYTNGQVKPVVGVALRARMEHADAAWVLSSHATEAEARAAETIASLEHRLPTLPFVARRGRASGGLVADQRLIDEVFASIDIVRGGEALIAAEGFDLDHPHFATQSYEGRRRIVTVTLCGDHRGSTPMHCVAVGGRDPDVRRALEAAGLSVRAAERPSQNPPRTSGGRQPHTQDPETTSKNGSRSWRYESCFKDFGAAMAVVERIRAATDVHMRLVARLGKRTDDDAGRNTLPFMPASSVRPGMAMFAEDGGYDLVESVERVTLDAPVYDLDVADVHNFLAAGLVTHNSIYSFRGADIRNILEFQEQFPEAHVVRLEQNYRSTQTILDAANAVISNNRGRMSKSLWSDVGEGDPVRVRELDDEYSEARFVVGEIERLVDAGASRAEIAVFYRTNAQSRVLEDTLVRAQIGYQVIGGTKFYERAEIKDAIAYLTWLVNPQDAGAFARVANSPKRGLGQTSLGRVLSFADTMGVTVWDAAAAPHEISTLGTAAVRGLTRFMSVMARLRERAEGSVPVAELLAETLRETGYLEALEAERTIEAQGRLENLHELVNVAAEYDQSAGDEGAVDRFLQQISLLADADDLRDDEGLVTLMTLHNAKGLEFPIVFIIGLEDGVFPHQRALDEGQVEEERRLAYVGLTRAMRDLYLTCARRRATFGGPGTYGMRSRFLTEIPRELTDQPPERRGAFGGGAIRERAVTTWAAADAAASLAAEPVPSFGIGDDVVHAAFGDGVVTGVEPGGVVAIRFAGDGSERKLMAELAPIQKRSR